VTPKQRLAYLVYRALAWAGRNLPERAGRAIYTRLGRWAARALPGVRGTVTANQAQVLGRPVDDPLVEGAVRAAFERYARYWFDSFHILRVGDDEVARRFRVTGREHMEAALEAGNGLIMALPHMGNWDVAGRWLSSQGHAFVTVAERLEPERLYELFLEHRRALGMEVIGLGDGGVGRQLAAALAEDRVVCLVADRDLTGGGVEVEMFGCRRRVPAGPALLSLTTGAPLMVVAVREEAGDWRCVMSRPVEVERSGNRRADVTAITRAMARGFEEQIAASPPDWHLFQPGWDP
jgi:KDO2-lipid IV(A) lauroyltransferase